MEPCFMQCHAPLDRGKGCVNDRRDQIKTVRQLLSFYLSIFLSGGGEQKFRGLMKRSDIQASVDIIFDEFKNIGDTLPNDGVGGNV